MLKKTIKVGVFFLIYGLCTEDSKIVENEIVDTFIKILVSSSELLQLKQH